MGMYDSVVVPCPKCLCNVEFESNADVCQLKEFKLTTAPPDVLLDIINRPQRCSACGQWVALVDPHFPPGAVPEPAPKPKIAKVDTPVRPWVSGPFQLWPHDREFTYCDLTDGCPE